MMKKAIAALAGTLLLLFCAAGCGGDEAPAPDAGASARPEESAGEAPEADAPAETSDPVRAVEPDPGFDNDWTFDTPEHHGVDGAVLARLHDAVAEEEIHSIVTVRHGVVIDEYYKEGYDADSVFPLHSCSKSFTGALVGLAIEQGHLSGVDALMSAYLPQLADAADDARKRQITIEHLLTHTSGLEWYEWGGSSASWRPFRESEHWVEYILSRSLVANPGSYFAYTTGGSHLLAAILQEATGQTALEYGREQMFDPMGMDSVEWGADAQGVIDGGNGIAMTARDAAKFGQLYLDGGRWRGRQILPEDWVEASVQRIIPGADNAAAYGYQWWVRSCGAANYETYYAMGAGGQFIFVVPQLDLVTVMTSRSRDTYAPRTYFIDYVLAACEEA